jgi:alpha-1,2-mannosyltransferase
LPALVFTAVLVASAGVLFAALFTAFGSQRPDELGWDFRVAYFPAAQAIVDGESPYPAAPNDPALDEKTVYAYPPQLAFLITPLTPFSVNVAVVVAVVASLVALFGALALVGVRDVRCYAVVVIWGTGWNALEMANVSALLTLFLALAWRFRATIWPLAATLGVMVSTKLFLWPMLVWAVATRRVRTAGLAILLGFAVTIATWAMIGFAGMREYPDLLSRVASQDSYSVQAMVDALGLGSEVAYAVTILVGGGLLATCFAFARRADDQRAFIVGLAAAFAMSPVVWLHYLVMLAVPLGIARPRLSPIWLLPMLLWVSPRSENGTTLDPFLPGLVAATILALLLARPSLCHERVAAAPA